MLRALRDKSHLVRLPQNLQVDMGMIRKARYQYAVENQGVSPREADLAAMLQWPAARVDEALNGLVRARSESNSPLKSPTHHP